MHRTYWIICLQILGFLNLAGQTLTTEQQAFLRRNVKTVCQEADFSLADWSTVSKAAKNKRIVLIGEPNHGSAEIFRLRNELIKHFHEKFGFNVILFESGMGELLLADINKSEMTPAQMTNGLIWGWRTPEFEALMEYVKTANLSIAGFDVQRSGGSFNSVLKSIAQSKSIDTTRYLSLEERYGATAKKLTHKKAVYDSVSVETQQLIADYQTCYQALNSVKEPVASKRFGMVLQVIQNRISYLSYMLEFLKDKNWDKRWVARDSAMAGNLVFLCEQVFKNEKILVVGHNYHIAKFNENQLVMGEMLKDNYPEELYSIGVIAGKGSFKNNFGTEEQMLPADSNALDIKHIIAHTQGAATFIPIPQKKKPGSEWLFQKIIVNDTFIDLKNSNRMELSRHFDGLILLKEVSPAGG